MAQSQSAEIKGGKKSSMKKTFTNQTGAKIV